MTRGPRQIVYHVSPGCSYSGGCWGGYTEKLPEAVLELEREARAEGGRG